MLCKEERLRVFFNSQNRLVCFWKKIKLFMCLFGVFTCLIFEFFWIMCTPTPFFPPPYQTFISTSLWWHPYLLHVLRLLLTRGSTRYIGFPFCSQSLSDFEKVKDKWWSVHVCVCLCVCPSETIEVIIKCVQPPCVYARTRMIMYAR